LLMLSITASALVVSTIAAARLCSAAIGATAVWRHRYDPHGASACIGFVWYRSKTAFLPNDERLGQEAHHRRDIGLPVLERAWLTPRSLSALPHQVPIRGGTAFAPIRYDKKALLHRFAPVQICEIPRIRGLCVPIRRPSMATDETGGATGTASPIEGTRSFQSSPWETHAPATLARRIVAITCARPRQSTDQIRLRAHSACQPDALSIEANLLVSRANTLELAFHAFTCDSGAITLREHGIGSTNATHPRLRYDKVKEI
jgi:hypothetical protein